MTTKDKFKLKVYSMHFGMCGFALSIVIILVSLKLTVVYF